MSARVIIEANEVWNYFQTHRKELDGVYTVIASYEEYGIEVYLSEDANLPVITVMADDEELYEEMALTSDDCYKIVEMVYTEYLDVGVMDILMDKDTNYDTAEEVAMIEERESELDETAYEFLVRLVPNVFEITEITADDLAAELVDNVCEWLYKEYGVSTYRPMYLENQEGEAEFVEFPYPEMEL